jgi:hypothetical protein
MTTESSIPLSRVALRHVSPGRLRLRVLDEGLEVLQLVTERLRACALVDAASSSPVTRTVLLLHRGGTRDLLAFGQGEGIFVVVAPPRRVTRSGAGAPSPSGSSTTSMAHALHSLDRGLFSWSGGRIDLTLLTFASLVGAAAWQARRGSLFPPAVSLVSMAFRLVHLDVVYEHEEHEHGVASAP